MKKKKLTGLLQNSLIFLNELFQFCIKNYNSKESKLWLNPILKQIFIFLLTHLTLKKKNRKFKMDLLFIIFNTISMWNIKKI